MTRSLVVLLLLAVYWFSSCGSDQRDEYDKGYEAAWEGEEAPSSWASKKEKEGYQNGLDDSWIYDLGYDDGHEGKRPQYHNDIDYMDGYKDGKENRE